jgi:hypothetical protein
MSDQVQDAKLPLEQEMVPRMNKSSLEKSSELLG